MEPLNPRTQSGQTSKGPHTGSAVRQVHASPRSAHEHHDFGQAAPPRRASVSPSAGWGDDNAPPPHTLVRVQGAHKSSGEDGALRQRTFVLTLERFHSFQPFLPVNRAARVC